MLAVAEKQMANGEVVDAEAVLENLRAKYDY